METSEYLNKEAVKQACSTCDVVRANSAKFFLHADTMKLNIHN
jgi:hypothetical protein